MRVVDLAKFMAALGLPYVLETVGYPYMWDMEFKQYAERVRTAKTDWLTWIAEQDL